MIYNYICNSRYTKLLFITKYNQQPVSWNNIMNNIYIQKQIISCI